MRVSTFLLLAFILILSSCDRNPAELVPDNAPNVATARINGLSLRRAPDGDVLAPAEQMYNPNTNTTVESDGVPVEITASDEREVVEVVAVLRQGTTDAFGDVSYEETWRDILTQDDDEQAFRNPFTFKVPFEGEDVGLVPASIEVIAKDNAGQENAAYTLDLQVDGSLAFLNATVPDTPQSGTFGIVGSARDPESGIRRFIAEIDGDEVFSYTLGDDKIPSYADELDAEALGNGPHFLTLYAINGVNEAVVQDFQFNVFVNEAPSAEDDETVTDVNTSVTINVLENDSDEDGDPITITSVTTPNHGTAVIQGNALIVYTPDTDFTGTDTFFYTIADTNGAVDSGQVTVVVGQEEEPAP